MVEQGGEIDWFAGGCLVEVFQAGEVEEIVDEAVEGGGLVLGDRR